MAKRLWIALVLVACTKAAPVVSRGIAVKVAKVQRTSDIAGTRYSAQIVPNTRIDVAFKVGGYVDSIAQVKDVDGQLRPLQEGDMVQKGDELASLRKTDYLQKIAEAKAAVAQAYSIYNEAKLDAGRDAKLVQQGSLAGAAADASRGRRDSAAAVADGARARLDEAKSALSDATLVAQISGVIVKKSIDVGALAAPGTVAFSVADVENVKAVFGVPDVFLPEIQLGALQNVTTDAFPGVLFEGKVSRLAPAADLRSRVFDVDVMIPNADHRLKAGMVAALSIKPIASGEVAVPLVPLGAIVRPPNGKTFAVYVLETANGVTRARAREVELGDYLGRVVPVKKGLAVGESVIVQGTGLLSDGERVEVIP